MAKHKKLDNNKKSLPDTNTSDNTKLAAKSKLPTKPSIDFIEESLGDKSIFLLLGLLSFIMLLVYGNFWYSDNILMYKDIGSDTFNFYYPTYYANAEQWRQEGIMPTWSFASGLGQDVLLGGFGDPFVLLMYWLGKDNIIYTLGYIEPTKVLLAGLCFYAYLRTMKLNYMACIVGGLMYAFSGFMIVGSGWYVFTIEGLYFAMLLLAFERFLLYGKWGMFPVVLMLICIYQPLDVYIAAVFIATYGTVRILHVNNYDLKDLFKKYAQLVALALLGLCMGALMLFPSLLLMFNSPRVLGESSFFETLQAQPIFGMANADLWATTKARLLSSTLLMDSNFQFRGAMNFLEAPALYCGLGTLLLVPQAFAFMSKKERISYGILIGLYIFPLLFPYFRYAFWLFAGDYFRFYSLLVIFILLLMSVKAIHSIYEEKRVSWIGLGVGGLMVAYFLYSIPTTDVVVVNDGTKSIVGLLLLLNIVLVAIWSIGAFRSTARIAFLFLLCIDIISVAKPTLNNRSVSKAAEFNKDRVGYNDYTKDAIQHIKSIDSDFYRVEKYGYSSGLAIHGSMNDAKVQGYMGTKYYHSFNHLNFIRFMGALGVIDQTDENQTRWAQGIERRQLLNMLVSNKYILTKAGPANPVGIGYKHIKTFEDVSIFENQHFLPLGFTYDKMVSRSDFDQITNNNISKDITLLKAVVIEDNNKEISAALEKFDTNQVQPQVYTEEALAQDVNDRKQEAFQLKTFKNAHITGEITVSKAKMLFFSIPFDQGWSAKVDGKETTIHQINIGFSGLMLEAGKHKVELVYATPYASLGRWVSLLGVLIYAAAMGWWYKFGNKQDKEKEGETIAEEDSEVETE